MLIDNQSHSRRSDYLGLYWAMATKTNDTQYATFTRCAIYSKLMAVPINLQLEQCTNSQTFNIQLETIWADTCQKNCFGLLILGPKILNPNPVQSYKVQPDSSWADSFQKKCFGL